MAIKRYIADADTTITNAYASNLETLGTGSNMGEADVVEVFSIYSQVSSSTAGDSLEKSRGLYKFPVDDILQDRNDRKIPISGSAEFTLKLFNVKHSHTLPKKFTLVVAAVSQSWEEGYGLDMEGYADKGYANWTAPASASGPEVQWDTAGGTFLTSSEYSEFIYEQYFENGTEDLEIDITGLVEKWIANDFDNYGLAVYLTSTQEDGSSERSYYTKKFFARGTEYFNKRPIIETRWDSSLKDDSSNFFLSSSLVNADDNLNNLYLYNFPRGNYSNIPTIGEGEIHLSLYPVLGGEKITLPVGGGVATNDDANVTGSWVSNGIYSASFAYTGSSMTVYPVWHKNSIEYYTGSAITVKNFNANDYNKNYKYINIIKNLKPLYSREEQTRFRLFTRQKDWSPTIYTRATSRIRPEIIESAFYSVERVIDGEKIISYGTSSTNHTKLSYDASGSYFDLDMSLFEAGYSYGMKVMYYINGSYREQPEIFKFRVE